MNSLREIERAISSLNPRDRAALQAWLERHRPGDSVESEETVFEQGLGLFGSAEDAALLDDAVQLAYEERRRPSRPSRTLR